MQYSELVPNNLGIIFRKEFTDLRDSTVKDFERYTNLKVDSQRNAVLGNGSIIMFRHIEELHNIQNVNLGWFAIEQIDELDSDEEFFTLFGRLRRQLEPTKEFLDLGLPLHSGFVIGNSGDYWGKRLWKEGYLDNAELFEATTFENEDILTKDFLESLEILAKNKPAIYQQYVMNSWDVTQSEFTLIRAGSLNALKCLQVTYDHTVRIISCDPSLGGDECVIQVIENGDVIHQEIMHENDETKISAKIAMLGEDFDVWDFCVDAIGIGHGVATILNNLVKKRGKSVVFINSAESATIRDLYFNKRSEMWFYVSQQVLDKKIPYPKDEETRRQLMGVRYEPIRHKGRVKIEDKQLTKKRLKCSPDRADAYVYGIYHLQFVDENRYTKKPKDNYKKFEREESNLGVCNY